MTTKQIESLANPSNLAKNDFDVPATLRLLVIPKFLLDVQDVIGNVSWRRKALSLSIVVGTRDYNLPADFEWLERLQPYDSNGTQYEGLKYIGEDPVEVSVADSATSGYVGQPRGYYIIAGSGVPSAIRLNTYPDQAYTMRGTYYWRIPFADDDTDVDLDSYIPAQFQGGLVHLLRSHLYADRYGIGDQRAPDEERKYKEWVAGMKHRKESASRNHARFMR